MTARAADAAFPRRAELLAALSLAIDLGLGQPMEHVLRSAMIGLELARTIDLPADRRETLFYATFVAWIGCAADSRDLSEVFGDDIAFRHDIYYEHDRAAPGWGRAVLGHVARGAAPADRARRVGSFVLTRGASAGQLIQSHCLSAGLFADRLGLPGRARAILPELFER